MSGGFYFIIAVPRRPVFVLAAFCVAIGVGLGVAEFVVRGFVAAGTLTDAPILKIEGTDFYPLVYDAELGWKNRPGSVLAQFGDRKIEITHDSHGFRNDEVAEKKPADVFRILILGDSVAWGWGVDQQEIYSKLLAQKLNERRVGTQKIEVVNAGVSGYGTVQELLLFRRIAGRVRPDLVLLHYFDNDVGDNCRMWDYGAWRPVMIPIGDRWLVKNTPCPIRLPRPLEPARLLRPRRALWRAELYRVLVSRSLDQFALARFFGWLGLWSIEPNASIQLDALSCTSLTIGLIHQLDKEARASGAKFAVVFDAWQKPVADGIADLPHIDMHEEFARRNVGPGDIRISNSVAHFNQAGHQLAAELILDFLTAHGLVPQSPQ